MIPGKMLFPTNVLHAFNALQYLRALVILEDVGEGSEIRYATCEDIAGVVGAPIDSLWRSLMHLARAGIVEVKKGHGGGYCVTPQILFKVRVIDVLRALGRELPDNGNVRASDRLNNAVTDCLDVTLEEFFK